MERESHHWTEEGVLRAYMLSIVVEAKPLEADIHSLAENQRGVASGGCMSLVAWMWGTGDFKSSRTLYE